MFNPHQKSNFTIICLVATFGISTVSASDFASYRGFDFGMTLAASAKKAGTKESAARTIHQKPALIQELDWRPRSLRWLRQAIKSKSRAT